MLKLPDSWWKRSVVLVVLLAGLSVWGCKRKTSTPPNQRQGALKTSPQKRVAAKPLRLLSAFFGLDNTLTLPRWARPVCPQAVKKDGMPIVFSEEIDQTSMQPTDFLIVTKSGKKKTPICVTLRPAGEEDEDRTALLIGDFGDHPNDPPVKVQIVSSLLAEDGRDFKGQSVAVIPLTEGPTIIYAESFPASRPQPKRSIRERLVQRFGKGKACPKSTKQVVRVIWTGGIRAVNGKPHDPSHRKHYHVTFRKKDGTTYKASPQHLADLGDNDNNIELCFATMDNPTHVEADAGFAIDPRDDKNPKTSVAVVPK
ncbi:MAG: hypothetical protein EP343_14065 [Deltaproteobacteria bacterium]|nr:MAG: hypothetical protein EP343_14065 [Deltaproteobacteria bacterium]